MCKNTDSDVIEILDECITEKTKKSFFLFAGAGSGKTYSLIELLKRIQAKWEQKYTIEDRKVAVITFTNAATDEICRRMDFSEQFSVSTIHSFIWAIIEPFQKDIKATYLSFIDSEIADLQRKQESAKNKTTATYLKNQDKLNILNEKRMQKSEIRKFTYNPNGDNFDSNSLNHAEIIKIGTTLISTKTSLQEIIAQKFPILLIDESQDTNKDLLDAFLQIQVKYPKVFVIGLLGDIKQRIYSDGKTDMASSIPKDWATPIKRINYRCAKRIIRLGNRIGLQIDPNAEQQPRENAPEGTVRMFIVNTASDVDKEAIEAMICTKMSEATNDEQWSSPESVKILTLEHAMAARRLGFYEFHNIFSNVAKYKMAYNDGTVTTINFFTHIILPLVDYVNSGNNVGVMKLLRENSPILSLKNTDDFNSRLMQCHIALMQLVEMCNAPSSTIRQVVDILLSTNLISVDDILTAAFHMESVDDVEDVDEEIIAWVKGMELPISMIRTYYKYVNQETKFDTHQGVKGLEYDRVMVIMDDNEAKGFLFSYDKLFGAKPLSETDKKHIQNKEDSTLERTTRLLYVTCTRAKESLALVVYTDHPDIVKQTCIDKGWFDEEDEIVQL